MPYKLPLASAIRPASGYDPFVPLNVARVLSACVPAATSNTVPLPFGPAVTCRAVQVAAGVGDQAGIGISPVRAIERNQGGERVLRVGGIRQCKPKDR